MKKAISISLLLAFVVPNVVSAAWWKPSTWKIFNKNLSPKIATTTTPIQGRDQEIENLKKQVEELQKTTTKQPVQPTYIAPPQSTKLNSSANAQNETLYGTILSKYNSLKEQARKDIDVINENVSLSTPQEKQISYLNNLISNLNTDIDELSKTSNTIPKPSSVLDFYSPKIERIIQDYNYQKSQFGQASLREARSDVSGAALDSSNSKKQMQLDLINQKIVELNAKYVNDSKNCNSTGADLYFKNACLRTVDSDYSLQYNILQVEYQKVLYSN